MKLYGTITKSEKQADGTMIVMGYASSESKDVDGEIIKADAIKGAIPDYMKFANVREMHKADKAAGTVLEMEVQADGRTFVKTHIVDAEACKKVAHNVYKGFSIGGKVTERDADDKTIIKGIRLSEISLVDRPANPDSIFTFAKVDDGEGDGVGAGVDATKPTEGAAKEGETAANSAAGDAKTGDAATNDNTAAAAAAMEAEGAPAAKEEGDADKSAKADDLKKGMYAVSTLASLLSSVNYLAEDTAWEAEYEGDDSTVPAQLKAWLKAGGEILKLMVTEEVAELVGEDDGIIVDVITLADKAKTLIKAAWGEEDADKFAKGFDALVARRNDTLAKSGNRNNKADQANINQIHEAIVALGASCGMKKFAGGSDDLKKMAAVAEVVDLRKALGVTDGEDSVAKAAELVEVVGLLADKVKKFEAMPAPAKASVRVIEKGQDASALEAATTEKTVEKTDGKVDPKGELKKVYAGGAKIV